MRRHLAAHANGRCFPLGPKSLLFQSFKIMEKKQQQKDTEKQQQQNNNRKQRDEQFAPAHGYNLHGTLVRMRTADLRIYIIPALLILHMQKSDFLTMRNTGAV